MVDYAWLHRSTIMMETPSPGQIQKQPAQLPACCAGSSIIALQRHGCRNVNKTT